MIEFFYDESENSRKLTNETVLAENFNENFVTTIIGIDNKKKEKVEKQYKKFDDYFKSIYTIKEENELKSTVLKPNKYLNGLVSFKKDDLNLINKYIDILISNNLQIYITVLNKIEFLILQLLKNYNRILFVNYYSLVYTITKIISLYKPKKVMESIYNNNDSFVIELKKFMYDVKIKNIKENLIHKEDENNAIDQIILVFDNISKDFNINWNYKLSFDGFLKYLKEIECSDYSLIIDKEGNGDTLQAAKNIGVNNCSEIASNESIGLRISDFLAGIVSSFLKAINKSFVKGSTEKTKDLLLINQKWFDINENHLEIYKKIKKIIIDQHKVCDKIYSGNYCDSLYYFIGILNYFDSFNDINDFKRISKDEHQLLLNTIVIEMLKKHFVRIENKMVAKYTDVYAETSYDKNCDICYQDFKEFKTLEINSTGNKYYVLSVGFFEKSEIAYIIILENNKAKRYLLPDNLKEWVSQLIILKCQALDIFPSYVYFSLINGIYCADLL